MYPNVCKTINQIKKNNHNALAILPQNTDVDEVVYRTLNQLQDEGHRALTIHDSIWSPAPETILRAVELIEQNMKNVYDINISLEAQQSVTEDSEMDA